MEKMVKNGKKIQRRERRRKRTGMKIGRRNLTITARAATPWCATNVSACMPCAPSA